MTIPWDEQLKLRREELEVQRGQSQLMERQRKTNATVSIVAALVALIAALGAQLIARPSNQPAPAFSLHLGQPVLKGQGAGLYVFDNATGQVWEAKLTGKDSSVLSWVSATLSRETPTLPKPIP